MTKWPRDRLLAELKRALEASLHEHGEAMFSEVEARLIKDGWAMDYSANNKLLVWHPPHADGLTLATVGHYGEIELADVFLAVNPDTRWMPSLGW